MQGGMTANLWQPIFRAILEELAPEVGHSDIKLLKQAVEPLLFPQRKNYNVLGGEIESDHEREKILDEQDYYSLAATIVLFTYILLPPYSSNEIDGNIRYALNPPAFAIFERLLQTSTSLPRPSIEENDLLGRAFQMLLPPTTRKRLAAFYTKSIVAKFVACLVINEATGSFLDPACGTGAFLMAASQRFQVINPSTHPTTLVNNIHGIEISPIARLCAETNLKLQSGGALSKSKAIQQGDAFQLQLDPSDTVNFLATNPPFTRGERLTFKYKAFLRSFFSGQYSPGGDVKIQYCTKNMSLHGYFLLDMDRFLRPGGRFGVVLPASTLQLAGLMKIRKYLLEHYSLDYVITSEVEPFSEDSDLKEIIMIGRLQEAKSPAVAETAYITIFAPLSLQNYSEFANIIVHPVETRESGKFIRMRHVKHEEMREGIADWSAFFPSESNLEFEEHLWSGGIIGHVRDLERDSIEVFRGFRQDFAKFWAVPNPYWILKESRSDLITIQNVEEVKFQITLPASAWHRGLARPEFYPRPLIETAEYFILKEVPATEHEAGLGQFLIWVEQHFAKDSQDFGKFLQQLHQIGARFAFAGRIAFCHRIDVTTSKIMCFLAPESVQLNQNWFSIRGLDPTTEELLVAWFNSTLFIAMYMQRRRTQRGPYGQTAVREFREYAVPLPDKLDSKQRNLVINQFRQFNKSSELDLPIYEQVTRSRTQKSSRKEFDLVVLDALQIYPSQREKQSQFLEDIYSVLIEKIEKVRLQGKQRGL